MSGPFPDATSPDLREAAEELGRILPQALDALAPRFEVLAEVGRGGMGAVFHARQRSLDRPVALKVMLPWASPERFLRGAQLLARVRSPHVVAVHDYELLSDGTPVLVMEWVEGRNLLQVMKDHGGRLPEAMGVALMRQSCRGMLAAAEEGVIHRDLKPSNVLVDRQGQARVADFDLARGAAGGVDVSTAGVVVGTPFYMAPEQWEQPRAIDGRADIYSFGATFYHALTGDVPFTGQSPVAVLFLHKTEPLVSPRARNPQLSARTAEVVERCLAKAPQDRFQSFSELLAHLEPEASLPAPWDAAEDARLAALLRRYQGRREVYVLRLMSPGEEDAYELPNGRVLKVVKGSIVDQDVEAVVSSDDGSLTMSGGVSRAIREAAGPEVVQQARRLAPVRAGRAIVTAGGRLRARYVFHGITLEFSRDPSSRPTRDLISEIVASCFYLADSHYVERIAFPLLGTGTAGFPEDVCLDAMFRALARTLLYGLTGVREARLVLFG